MHYRLLAALVDDAVELLEEIATQNNGNITAASPIGGPGSAAFTLQDGYTSSVR